MMKFNLKEFRERSGATDEATGENKANVSIKRLLKDGWFHSGEKNTGLPSISDVTIAKLGVKRMTLRGKMGFCM